MLFVWSTDRETPKLTGLYAYSVTCCRINHTSTLVAGSEMASAGLRAYREVLRLVRRLPADTRPYYAKYARENFVNYRDLSADDDLIALLRRAHAHSAWVLSKYSIDEGEAGRLKELYRSHGGQ